MTAGRRAQKARSKTAPARGGAQRAKGKVGQGDSTLKARLVAAERERDTLRADLQRVETKLRSLEKTQEQVRDRIAWALDSLHNILEGKG